MSWQAPAIRIMAIQAMAITRPHHRKHPVGQPPCRTEDIFTWGLKFCRQAPKSGGHIQNPFKKIRKGLSRFNNRCSPFRISLSRCLFRILYRDFSKFLHHFHDVQSCLTGTGSCCFIAFLYLSISICCKRLILCLDLIYKLFHFSKLIIC